MDRTKIAKEIGDIIEYTCKKCEDGVAKNKNKNQIPCPTCEHGILLRQLGDSLDSFTTKAREEKQMAQSDKLQSLTVGRYKELSEAMTEHEIAKYLDTTIHYIKKWKQERGLVEKRKTTKDTAQTSVIDRTATEQGNRINSYAEEIKTLKEENKKFKACVDKKDEEIQRLHNRIELLEQQNKQVDTKIPETPQEALQAVLNGLEVVCDYDTHKRVESAVSLVDRALWVEGRYRKKYGPSPMDIFTKELYYKFRRNGLTQQQMAKETGLTFEQVKYIVGHYVRRPVVEESEAKKEVRNIKTKSLKKFTREEYLALKEKKIPDSAIRKHFGVYDKAFCDWKHKHGLIGVRNKRGGRFEIYG